MAIVIRSINKFIFQASCSSNNGVGNKVKKQPPIFVSTNPSNINIHALSKLYCACNHSPHRFSAAIEDIDAGKLGIAISHSSVVVSVFASVTDCDEGGVEEKEKGLLGRILPAALVGVPAENGELVGFGRAASDQALTASIYDVMVLPSLRRLGIGRMIVQRIIRNLVSKGIYDISALCTEEERLFFAACGFGDDILGSTTMMYAKTSPDNIDNNRIIT
ncbi:GCN5-related N-acetyltransferase 3, chloroplastic [Amaranthus tricolor]|uniref:GCN5-related N-acetyltransferase 3, chloroplastic n=1 Tax=Amaranthus tricolor TaxID=29722 RepID=UPI00258AAA37|nr:GCN5-related N-acetyltransferase 3, chloroplastic [Amaranthus tricolor]